MSLMSLGAVFLSSMATGVLTEAEVSWIAAHQGSFNRHEAAVALRLGRLLDEGTINLGCRLG